LIGCPHKRCINTGQDRYIRETLGHSLHSDATTQGKDGIYSIQSIAEWIQKLTIALPFHGMLQKVMNPIFTFCLGDPQCMVKKGDFALAASITHCHTGATAQDQYLIIRRDEPPYFL
jgi:hypothetical protein